MENTKRKSILIILFIFILIVAGLLYFLTNYNTDTKKKDTPKKDTPVSQTDKDVIIEKISKYKLFALSYYDEELDFATEELTEPKLELLYAYVSDTLNEDDTKAYFGDLYAYVPTEYKPFICSADNKDLLSYNSSTKTYYINKNHPGHGGKIYEPLDFKIVDFKQDNNIFTVSVIFLSGNNADGFYTNDKELLLDIDPDTNGDGELTEEEYQEYLNSIKKEFKNMTDFKDVKKYIYTFEKIGIDNSHSAQYSYVLKGFKKSL